MHCCAVPTNMLLFVSRVLCRHLQSLTVRNLPKLRDKALTPLASAAGRLLHLDLLGCSGVTSKSLTVLGQLTSLHSLVLTGSHSLACVLCCHQSCKATSSLCQHSLPGVGIARRRSVQLASCG